MSSVISNFETVEEVIETSMNSSGSAMAENAKWLDSIEGKTYQFTNALETMWSNMIDSSTVKQVIDFGTKLIQFLDTTPGKITAIVVALAGIAKFKGFSLTNLIPDAINGVKQYSQVVTQISAINQAVKNNQKGSVSKILGTGDDLQKHTVELQAYADAVRGLSAEEQAATLTKQGLNREQVAEIMRRAGVKDEVIQETLSKKMLSNVTSTLSKTTVEEFMNANLSAEALQNEAVAAFMAENGHKRLNKALLDEMRTRGIISNEQYLQYIQQLGASFGATLKQIAKSPMVITMAATAITGLISSIKTAKEETEELTESYNDLQSSISELEGEISSLESELSGIQEQIDELESKESLSFADAEQLTNLKAQSAELEHQKEMREHLLKIRDRQEEIKSLKMINNLLNTTAAGQQKAAEDTAKGWKTALSIVGAIGLGIAGWFTGGATTAAIPTVLAMGAGGAMVGSAVGEKIGYSIGSNSKATGDSLIAWYESYEKAIQEAESQASEAESKYLSDVTDYNYKKWQEKVDAVNTLQTELYDGLQEMGEYVSNLDYNSETSHMIDGYNDLMAELNAKSMDGDLNAQIESIQALESEFKELSKGVDEHGNNISLSSEEYARYNSIVKQVLSYQSGLVKGYNDVGDAVLYANGQLINYNDLIIEAQNELRRQKQEAAKDAISFNNLDQTSTSIKNSYASQLPSFEAPFLISESGFPRIFSHEQMFNEVVLPITGDSMSSMSELTDFLFTGTDLADYINRNSEQIVQNKQEILDAVKSKLAELSNTEGMFGEDVAEAYYAEFENWMNELEGAIKSPGKDYLQNQTVSFLNNVPQASDYYYDFSEEQLSRISDYIGSYVESNVNNIEDVTTEKLLLMVNNISSFVEKLATDSDFQQLIGDLFAIDPDEAIDDYNSKITPLINQALQDGIIDDDTHEALLNQFKIDDDDINTMIEAVDKKLTDGLQGNLTSILNKKQLEIAFEQTKYLDDGSLSYGDLFEIINKYSNVVEDKVVKSYATLQEQVSQFNEISSQTSEILLDNTKVTQEYKDSLLELGLSEEDLAECFDAANPLVVKNARVLNSLVKNTKNVTAQNIKLAKSQARLEYYEKYKELQQLTNGKKVTTAATLNQVKAIYAEMTALQKSISRYSMLEHQLLGATNAYEEFAKAQEIDEANDYESKAEELVGYLVDAFQTGKLGTESAQAAIKGLVPESVYEDLDTLDEKMAAVYKYFTEDLSDYFYVKFNDDGSLESAEMLVDNVKKFVEDGIDKGVFTGSWEEWDLGETISSLDDLADRMGVTKEVAYAFLQAMETYDISWIGGDASTLLDKLIPTTSQINAAKESMQEIFNQTPIDLTARVKVSAEKMKEAGYTDFEGEYATVYSTGLNSGDFGLYNKDGSTYEILATPILPNGEVLSNDELYAYINKELNSGKSLNEIDVFIGAYDTVEQAEEAAQVLHEAQERYYNMLKSYSLEAAIQTTTQKQAELQYKIGTGQLSADDIVSADGKTTAQEQLNQLNKEAEANAKAARENVAEWTECKKAYDEAAEAVNKCNKELENAQKANDPSRIAAAEAELQKTEDTLWNTYAALADIAEPKEVVLTVALEQVEKDLEEAKKSLNETELDIVAKINVANLKRGEDGKWIVDIDAYSNLDEESKAKVQQYIDYLAEQHNINILQGEGAVTTLDVLTEIKDILAQTYTLMVETSDAETKTKTFSELWSGITDKTVTLWQNVKQGVVSYFTRTPDEGDGAVNGTAHVGGTAFASGSWGAPKTETALVGELGPEVLLRGNRWSVVGASGAEFTQVRKGDIIFNH